MARAYSELLTIDDRNADCVLWQCPRDVFESEAVLSAIDMHRTAAWECIGHERVRNRLAAVGPHDRDPRPGRHRFVDVDTETILAIALGDPDSASVIKAPAVQPLTAPGPRIAQRAERTMRWRE